MLKTIKLISIIAVLSVTIGLVIFGYFVIQNKKDQSRSVINERIEKRHETNADLAIDAIITVHSFYDVVDTVDNDADDLSVEIYKYMYKLKQSVNLNKERLQKYRNSNDEEVMNVLKVLDTHISSVENMVNAHKNIAVSRDESLAIMQVERENIDASALHLGFFLVSLEYGEDDVRVLEFLVNYFGKENLRDLVDNGGIGISEKVTRQLKWREMPVVTLTRSIFDNISTDSKVHADKKLELLGD